MLPDAGRHGPSRRHLLEGLLGGAAVLGGSAVLASCTGSSGGGSGATSSASPTTSPGATVTELEPTEYDASDPYRPLYHYSPASGDMADPNGLLADDGTFHLFHQTWGTWVHATSTDLMAWEDQGVALEHDDLGQAMSGSAVVDADNVSGLVDGGGILAFYTSTEGGEAPSVAYSTDGGSTWQRYEGNPVVANDGRADFRDPKVFRHEDSGAWVMVIAAGDHVEIHRSTDLLTWEHASDAGADAGLHSAVWECPDLFPLEDPSGEVRWVLHVSVGASEETEGSTAQYLLGAFDGTTFTPSDTTVRVTDAGQDFYAAQSFENLSGRRVWMAWAGNWSYPYDLPTGDWHGEMSVPRELSLVTVGGETVLAQTPVAEVEAYHGDVLDVSGTSVTDDSTVIGVGRSLDMTLELDVSKATKAWVSVARGTVDGALQEVLVGVDRAAKQLFLNREASGVTTVSGSNSPETDFALARFVDYEPVDERVRLRILLDRSSLEVFVDDGAPAATMLVLNDPGAQDVAVGADGTVTVVSGTLATMGDAMGRG